MLTHISITITWAPTDNPGRDLFKLYVRALQLRTQASYPHWHHVSVMFDMPDRDKDYTNQLDGLQDLEGNVIVDDIIKLEELPSDWKRIQDRIKSRTGQAACDLPHVNKSQRKAYQWYYDEDTYNIVADLFHKDIAYFDYSF